MVSIGIVGIGFMGMIHTYAVWGKKATRKVKGAKVVAICTKDPKKLAGDWRDIQGNFGPRGEMEDLSNIKTYNRIEDIISDPDINLLDVTLPTHLHKEVAIAGLKSGKHVLVEKPITLSLRDASEMVEAAKRAKRLLMVGQVLPFFLQFVFLREVVESGKYGRLLAAHFKRLIRKRQWSEHIAAKTGGPGIDLHIHDAHFIQLLCGMPDRVYSQGKLTDGGYVEYLSTSYIYDDKDISITCMCGALSQPGLGFTQGYEAFLERATLLFNSGGQGIVAISLTVLTEDGEVERPILEAKSPIDAFVSEIQYAVDAIHQNREPVLLSGEGARNALLLCHKEAESIKRGRVVRVGVT